jgi:hypothetical protein
MAAPMVSGVASLLKSYYPNYSMKKIKEIILLSGNNYGHTFQKKPGEDNKIKFSELSKSGKIVDLYKSVKMCESQR